MYNYPLRYKRPSTRTKNTEYEMRQERRKPVLPGPYVYVSGGTGSVSALATWQSPEWQNNFDFLIGYDVGFRHGLDGWTEYVGRIDLTLGAVTGQVAFTLPVPWRSLTFDFTFPVFVEGTTWWSGVLQTDKTTGDVTVYWPTEATAI